MDVQPVERVLRAISHQQPDRVPIDLRFSPELQNGLMKELGMSEKEFWEWVGQDVITIRPKFSHPASPIKYADPTIEIDPHGYYLDIYRVPFRKISNPFQDYLEPEMSQAPLANLNSIEELEKFPWPSVNDWDYSHIFSGISSVKHMATWSRSRGCFQTAQLMRGTEKFLIDLSLNPDYACFLMDRIMDFVIEDARLSILASQGKYTFVEYNDDIATQRGLLISPTMWRKYVKPRMKAFCDMVHGFGIKVKYHSCGSIYSVIPDLIEIGVDILNPIQTLAANMDPFKLKAEFGKDLCLHGGVDIQHLLPNGPKQEVCDYVQRLIDIVGKDGGYILAGTHTIQNDAKIDNVIAMIKLAKGGNA
jgi:uroporphyrinogen decarboxylase